MVSRTLARCFDTPSGGAPFRTCPIESARSPPPGRFDSRAGPPTGSQFFSEERTAVEFPLGALPADSIIDSVLLRLTPAGQALNIGLSAGEVSEEHGYVGDGIIQVADLMDSLAVASIAGATPNGAVTVALATTRG